MLLEAEAGGRHNRLVNRSWTITKQTNANPISNAIPSMGALLTRKKCDAACRNSSGLGLRLYRRGIEIWTSISLASLYTARPYVFSMKDAAQAHGTFMR
jgi:hypothetical protein